MAETAFSARAKRRKAMAATTSIRLQLLLVGEDVEVGEGVGLGIQIQVLPAHVGSRLAAAGEGRRQGLGIEAKLVGGGEGRINRGAGCGVGRKRCLSEEIPVVVVLAVHGGCAVWRSGRGGAGVGRNGGGVVRASEAAAGRSVSEMIGFGESSSECDRWSEIEGHGLESCATSPN